MGTFQVLALSIFIALLILENYGYGYWMISRPIFAGPLIGLIMGDMQTGLLVGGSVELLYMGVIPVGGSVPPNAQIAGIMSTVFAIMNGGDASLGIALALPIGLLAQLLIMLAWNLNIILIHGADKYVRAGDYKKVERMQMCGLGVFFLVFFIPTFLAINFGSDFVSNVVNSMPKVLSDGLKAASGILPAVGMAMLLKMMNFKKYWPFFGMAFVASVYLGLNVLSVALIALFIVMAMMTMEKKNDTLDDFDEPVADLPQTEGGMLSEKELRAVFRRSFFFMTTINYERYCSLGFCYAMIPALKVLYPKEEDFKEALLRHNEFFNCHPYTGNAVLGVTLALEEQRAMGKPITAESISATKAALMGPLSSIGDSVFKATFMTIFAAIAAAMALEGNVLAPFVFIVPNVALNLVSRWLFVKYGYKLGTNLVVKMKNSSIIDKFVEGATIVGMMVVGAMIVGFVSLNISTVWVIGEKEVVLQSIIDSIMPKLLPLLLVLGYYKVLTKYKKGMYVCIIASFILGIAGKAIGLL